MERSELRRKIRARRRGLTIEQQLDHASGLAEVLSRDPWFRNSQRIAAYLPVDGEMDPSPLIVTAWSMNKQVYLPVLVPFNHNRLWFAPYTPDTQLVRNRFGIPEPEIIHRSRSRTVGLDLVLTPLVSFDPRGNRLGMGGGFYDRTFAFLRSRRHWQRPRLLGIAYEFQKTGRLPRQEWDVPLCAVATEQQLYRF